MGTGMIAGNPITRTLVTAVVAVALLIGTPIGIHSGVAWYVLPIISAILAVLSLLFAHTARTWMKSSPNADTAIVARQRRAIAVGTVFGIGVLGLYVFFALCFVVVLVFF